MSAAGLFRKEVFESRVNSLHGPIRLAQPVSRSIVTIVTALIIVGVLALGYFGVVNKKARVTGLTVPLTGSVTISTPFSGVVAKILVNEGDYVRSGQPLFEIKTERLGEDGDINVLVSKQLLRRKNSYTTELSLVRERYRLDRANLKNKINSLGIEMRKLEEELAISTSREENIRKNVEQFAKLQQSGFLSASQHQQKENELLEAKSRTQSLLRAQLQLQAQHVELLMLMEQMDPREASDLEKIRSEMSVVEQQLYENSSRKGGYITAQQSGVISTISTQIGQTITPSRVLATLIPVADGQGGKLPILEVTLYVSSRNIGFVDEGNEVLLRYRAFPYQIFGLQRGRVTDVSSTPLTMAEIPENLIGTVQSSLQGSSVGQEALFRVRVALQDQKLHANGRTHKIRPGMIVEADIIQERQRLWQLFFGPALSIANSI